MPTAILAHHVTSAVSVSVKEAERASNNLSLPMDKILNQAAEIIECYFELGKEVALSMLGQCEEALREIIKAEMAFETITTINEFATKAVPDCDPLQLQAGFQAEADEKLQAKQSSGDKWFKAHPNARKLAKLVQSVKGGAADEDEVVCTQTTRELKCPILLLPLTETGDMRPVVPVNEGHTPRCVFSFSGINQFCKGKRGTVKCPMCTYAAISLRAIKDCKATARAIRKARLAAEDEEPDHMDATQID